MTEQDYLLEFIEDEKQTIKANDLEIMKGNRVVFYQRWNKDCEIKIKAFEERLNTLNNLNKK